MEMSVIFEKVVGIIWPNDRIRSSDVISEMRKTCDVEMIKIVKLNDNQMKELVLDVYSFETKLGVNGSKKIHSKIKRLEKHRNKNVVFVETKVESFQQMDEIKNRTRKAFHDDVILPFDVIHAASSKSENEHLSCIMNNASHYLFRPLLSRNLDTKLQILVNWSNEYSVNLNDVCVVGGAVMDLYGYKKCDDIDIIMSKSLRPRFTDSSAKELVPGLDVAKKNYAKKIGVGNWFTDNEIIKNSNLHVNVRGIKFAKIEIVKERKQYSKRSKDKKDFLTLINTRKEPLLVSPFDLISENRLDLVCKYLLFKQIESKSIDENIIDIYNRHIMMRTGGTENTDRFIDNQRTKSTLTDYLEGAKSLFVSMKTKGFDFSFPIPCYEGGIENGAHRIACSIALGIKEIPVFHSIPKRYLKWDRSWFENNGFTDQEISLLENTYLKLKETNENSLV
jgi:hypothetical protein